MLFYLTDSLITNDDSEDFGDVYNAIDNILKAYEERRHLVLGDINVLNWYKNLFDPRNPRYGTLQNLINTYATNTIPSALSEFVNVVKESHIDVQEINGRKIYNVPYSKFTSSESLQTTRIIGEDENDSKMYKLIFEWYKLTRACPCYVSVIYESGGGLNTHRKVRSHKNNNLSFASSIC